MEGSIRPVSSSLRTSSDERRITSTSHDSSLQKVTIDRVLRLVDAAGLEAEIKVRRAA